MVFQAERTRQCTVLGETLIFRLKGRMRMTGSYEQLYNKTEEFLNVIKGIKMSEEAAKRRETGLASLNTSTEKRISRRSVGKVSMRSTTSSVVTRKIIFSLMLVGSLTITVLLL